MQPTVEITPFELTNPLDQVAHLFCSNCPLDMAVCGYRIDIEMWMECDEDEETCALCIEMDDYPCPRCGSMC